jgi:glycosyltransferase involved in cell wall biosynthesis
MSIAGAPVELIVSIDESDPTRKEYAKLYSGYLLNDNKSVVEATNKAAAKARGDIFVYLSDDFKPFANWGKVVMEEFAKYTGPTLIKVDDMLQKFDVPVLTIPIMNRACYDKLGYFWHPGYKSMFVDEHLYWRSKKIHALKMAPHIHFEHCHVSVGKAKDDETYRASAANWDQGKALFAKHKMEGFVH